MGVLVGAIVAATGAGVVAAVGRRVVPYLPWVVGVGVLVLVGAACVVAPPTAHQEIVSGGGEAAPPATVEEAAPLTAAEVAAVVRQIAAPRGWKGAHLDDVLTHLPGHSREELLQVLDAAGIEVADQLKLMLPGGRQRNRQGVRLTALPPGAEEAPAGPATTPPAGPAHAPPEPAPRAPHLTVHGQ